MEYEKLKHNLLARDDIEALGDCFALCVDSEDHESNKIIRQKVHELLKTGSSKALDLYWKTHLFDASVSLDSFILYTEHNRQTEKQFYLPRRKQLKPLVDALQDLEEGKLEILGISLPPGVGKTTLAEFFLTWTGGRHPELPILVGSHSNAFLRGMYGEIGRMLDPQGDYRWNDVFPLLKVINTNAQDMMIDIGEDKRSAKRFATFEFSSIGSGNAGKVRAQNILYCDDLVDGLESALSRDRMDKLYNLYATDLRQRKLGDAKELHIATRWSVHDVLGRLEMFYEGNPKAKFIKRPALDENDESNFNYPYGVGYSTETLHEQREVMDDASWRALFMNEPIEREGQLYPEEELRRYFDLPDGEPEAVIAVCDTKDKGEDYCVLPIAYKYGDDYYIEGVVCDNSAPSVVETRLVMALMKHNVQLAQFESNSAGGKVAEKVQSEIKAKKGNTKIVTKYTTSNKETKIIVNSPFIKEHCLFKDNSVIKDDKEYRLFLRQLTGYTMAGKNKHDDVPDAMAQLALYCQTFGLGKVQVLKRFF
jgi:predicted phage terminase large subunit-like protein